MFVTLSQMISVADKPKRRQGESNEYCSAGLTNVCSHETQHSVLLSANPPSDLLLVKVKRFM